jgi:hypothetical protein
MACLEWPIFRGLRRHLDRATRVACPNTPNHALRVLCTGIPTGRTSVTDGETMTCLFGREDDQGVASLSRKHKFSSDAQGTDSMPEGQAHFIQTRRYIHAEYPRV